MPPQHDESNRRVNYKDYDNLRQQEEDDDGEDEETRIASTTSTGPSASHTTATLALCVCTFTNSWLMISVFPYSGFMAIDLIPSVNEENAGYYGGLLASSMMMGRALSSYGWGKMSDVYGRKTVLVVSMTFAFVFSLLFGFSTHFGLAMLFRFLMGFGNGTIGTTKTIVSELASGEEKLERKTMGLTMGMWGWGFLVCPAASGALAEPLRQYPQWAVWLQQHWPMLHQFLSKFPFVLPNIFGCLLCLLAIIAVRFYVPETLPNRRNPKRIPADFWNWATSMCSKYDPKSRNRFKRRLSDVQEDEEDNVEAIATLSSLWSQTKTRNHLLVYWAYSFVVVAVDEAFPLFCMSKSGGLAITEASIGKILSGCGAVYVASQYIVYSLMSDRFGLYASITIGNATTAPLLALVPVSLLLNQGAADDTMTWQTFVFLSILLGAYRVLALVFFSSIAIATNRTVAPSHRGTMNGLSMLGGSIAKGLGPSFSGFLVAFCLSSGVVPSKLGAVMVFCIIATLGGLSALASHILLYLQETKSTEGEVLQEDNEEEVGKEDIKDGDEETEKVVELKVF